MIERNSQVNQVVALISQYFRISPEIIRGHLSEPLNGSFFKFDSIDMVYLVLALKGELGIDLDDLELNRCAYWNVLEIAKRIPNN